MSEQPFEPDPLDELREIAAAAERLAKDEASFIEAFDAHAASDAGRFQAALERAGIADRCDLICVYFCVKRCGATCFKLCPERPTRAVDAKEVLEFTHAIARVAKDRRALERLLAIAEKEDKKAWDAELKKLELTRFCHQVCRFVCRTRCKRICRHLCARPLITRISSIPTAQFDVQGFGHGPSVPPFQVPPPNPAAGVGDHPIGASSWLMGVFNFPSATQYKLEFWTFAVRAVGDDLRAGSGLREHVPADPRHALPVGRARPGLVRRRRHPALGRRHHDGRREDARLLDDPGGRPLLPAPPRPRRLDREGQRPRAGAGRQHLPADAHHQARAEDALRRLEAAQMRPGEEGRRADPDHRRGARRQLQRALGRRGGELEPVGARRRRPRGDVRPAVPLSKTYNGNVADTGYPVPTSFIWDPWSDPKIVPCCYIVRIDIRDRAVLNNAWAGGHGGAGWEAIEIGF